MNRSALILFAFLAVVGVFLLRRGGLGGGGSAPITISGIAPNVRGGDSFTNAGEISIRNLFGARPDKATYVSRYGRNWHSPFMEAVADWLGVASASQLTADDWLFYGAQ